MQTRWGQYRAGNPNVVATAFAGHALLEAGRVEGRRRSERLARRAVALRVPPSRWSRRGGERFFAYYRGQTTPIHNASLLLAALAVRAAATRFAQEYAAAADAFAFTIARQRPDGSWPYGEGARLGWVDGFHTAYVLEALRQWHTVLG